MSIKADIVPAQEQIEEVQEQIEENKLKLR